MASRPNRPLGGELTPKTAAILNLASAAKTQAEVENKRADADKTRADAKKTQAEAEKTRAEAEKLREEQKLLRLRQQYQQQPPPLLAHGGPMPPTLLTYGNHWQQQSLGNFPPSGQPFGAPPSSTQSTGGQQPNQSTDAENQDNPSSGRQPPEAPANPWPHPPQLHNSFTQLEPSDPWGFHVEDATHTVTARTSYPGAPAIVLGPVRGRRPRDGVMRLLVRKSDGSFGVFHTSQYESR